VNKLISKFSTLLISWKGRTPTRNKKKKREISMALVTERAMLSRLWLNLPQKEIPMKIQMTPKGLARISH
jgi:hypothetical protein